MNEELAHDIKLEFLPNPEGDNSFEVKINEGIASLKYFASTQRNGQVENAGYVTLTFRNCCAANYLGTEVSEEIYPGWHACESDFCEVLNSKWAKEVTPNKDKYKHFLFCLNHQLFECIASSCEISEPIE